MLAVLNQRTHKHLSRLILKLRNKLKKDIKLSEYYFGYGANLDTKRFAKNNMQVEEVGCSNLKDHEIKFSLATEYLGKGYAGVHKKDGKEVPGVLVKIDRLSLNYLDKLEWCGFGAYKRVLKNVECKGVSYKAWVYIVQSPDFNRVPSTLYLQNMIQAAESRNFPKSYVDFLKQHKSKDSFELDHYFSLRTYSRSRIFVRNLSPIYKAHDKIRDKLCDLI